MGFDSIPAPRRLCRVRFCHSFAVLGPDAYVVDSSAGLHVIDVSDPVAPRIVGSGNTAAGVAVAVGYAFVTTGSAVFSIDVSDPTNPVVADTFESCDAGLRIVDLSDPTAPALVHTVSAVSDGQNLHVPGSYVFAASDFGGLQVVGLDR